MADEKKNQAKTEDVKSLSEGVKILANGPADKNSLVEVLRYQPDDKRKSSIDIRKGQILTVGQDISEQDADRLTNLNIWKFERVNE